MLRDQIDEEHRAAAAVGTPAEFLSRADVLLGLFGGAFLLVAATIRMTRMSSSSGAQSFHNRSHVDDGEHATYTCADHSLLGLWRKVIRSWGTFWGKFPRRAWNFYIEAFLVPAYRQEWGKFNIWSYRSRTRSAKSKELRAEARVQKRLLRQTTLLSHKRPRPIKHSHGECERIRINVGGMRYETQLRTLERFPKTLLGNASKRQQYYNPVTGEYYFDRHRLSFEAILYFYQSGGRFRRMENINADVLLEDAIFYELGDTVVEQFRVDEGNMSQSSKYELMPKNLLLRKIWLLFDYPESSAQSRIAEYTSIGALFVSIALFCMETLDTLELHPEYAVNDTGHVYLSNYRVLSFNDPFFLTETACNAWFIFELIARYVSCPLKLAFFRSPINLIDTVAVIPYLVAVSYPSAASLLEKSDESMSGEGVSTADAFHLLRILRLARVFRIFKLSKHSKGLKILGKTLRASLNELILLIFFVFIGVILFSSAVYFAELGDPRSQFHSIPGGFWWALITITTVGFGDIVPKTTLGKMVGSLCVVAGVLTIALPVPVIVSNFNFFYQQAINEDDLRWISINHVPSCPCRAGGFVSTSHEKHKHARENSSDEEFGEIKKG